MDDATMIRLRTLSAVLIVSSLLYGCGGPTYHQRLAHNYVRASSTAFARLECDVAEVEVHSVAFQSAARRVYEHRRSEVEGWASDDFHLARCAGSTGMLACAWVLLHCSSVQCEVVGDMFENTCHALTF